MEVQNLFNSNGEWLGFRLARNVFDTQGVWVGWLPWNDVDVANLHGGYLGTIADTTRLYRFSNAQYRGYAQAPDPPPRPDSPGYPGYVGYSPLPALAEDVIFAEDEYG